MSATLTTTSVKLTVKRKNSENDSTTSSSFNISSGASNDEMYDTAEAIGSLQDGEHYGYFRTMVAELLAS